MKHKKLLIFSIIFFVFSCTIAIMFFSIKSNYNTQNALLTSNTEKNYIDPNTHNDNPIIVELENKTDSHLNLSIIGDIMCHNSQYIDAYSNEENTYNFSYVFENIKDYINSADIAIGNLETTFAGADRGYSNYPQFNTPEQLAWNLKDLGIDILSTANNHCMDTGYSGLVSTLNYLDEVGISHIGTNRSEEEQNSILIKEINDIKIAFLSFTYGTNGIPVPQNTPYAVNFIDEDFMKKQIELAKLQNPDLICVNMHWGTEYQTTQNATQENLANFLFSNGVDIILGSHPHVLQPMERRSIVLDDGTQKDCFVIYSFGNFMSAQTQKNTQSSIILNIKITKNNNQNKCSIDNISYIPIYMYKSSSSTKKYSILDLQKSIFHYESGIDTSIGKERYITIKNEFERIKNIFNGFEIPNL